MDQIVMNHEVDDLWLSLGISKERGDELGDKIIDILKDIVENQGGNDTILLQFFLGAAENDVERIAMAFQAGKLAMTFRPMEQIIMSKMVVEHISKA